MLPKGRGERSRPLPGPQMPPRSLEPWRPGLYSEPEAEEKVFPQAGDGHGAWGWGPCGDARVKDEAGDILLGHARQLVGEDVLQPHKPKQHPPVGLGCQRVADDMELDDAAALLQAGCLVPGCVGRQQARLGTRGKGVSCGLWPESPLPTLCSEPGCPPQAPAWRRGR